jgi:hypothetical protein
MQRDVLNYVPHGFRESMFARQESRVEVNLTGSVWCGGVMPLLLAAWRRPTLLDFRHHQNYFKDAWGVSVVSVRP